MTCVEKNISGAFEKMICINHDFVMDVQNFMNVP